MSGTEAISIIERLRADKSMKYGAGFVSLPAPGNAEDWAYLGSYPGTKIVAADRAANHLHLLSGRFVFATKLSCLFPNLYQLVLREQTCELYMVHGSGRDNNTRNRSRRTGLRYIKDR